jgi:hypothetical protein
MFRSTVLSTLLAVALLGQDVGGSIAGRITDSTGAVIAGAEIVATHRETGASRNTKSAAEGDYHLPALPIGTYDISAGHAGFKKAVRKGVVLHVTERLGIDLSLEVGELATEIAVEASADQVRTESGDQGGTITGEQVRELQLNGRSFMTLLELIPGVVSNMSDRMDPNSNPDVSINGTRSTASNFNIDGGNNADVIVGSSAMNTFTSVETIAEFTVLTSAFSAEYGRGGVGQINVVTRGGTRNLHGGLFEFFRNDRLDARDFFSHAILPLKQNQFGFTLGGPVSWKGYNRDRTKTFFFVAQDYNRLSTRGAAVNTTVPTAAERTGDFRALGSGRDGVYGTTDDPVIDPATGAGFPGGVIPASRINPNGLKLASLYPLPNASGPGANNYTSASPSQQPFREDMIRIDHNFSSAIRLYGRYTQDGALVDNPYGGSGYTSITTRFPGIARTNSDRPGKNFVVNSTQILRPTLLNQFNFAMSRRYFDMHPVSTGGTRKTNGISIPEIFPENDGDVLPIVNVTNLASISVPRRGHKELWTFDLYDNLSYIRGRHAFKLGGLWSYGANREQPFNPNLSGTLNFDTAITKNAVAALLLGLPSTYTEAEKTVWSDIRFATVEGYVQDDVKVTPRLTVNVGLRISNFLQPYDVANVLTNFLPWRYDVKKAPTLNPSNGQIVPNTGDPLNGIVIAGKDSPYGQRVTNNNNFLLAPRFGFAWRPQERGIWVLRGGYGIYYTRAMIGTFENNAFNNPPFTRSVTIQRPTLADPGGGLLVPSTAPVNLTTLGLPMSAPYTQQWSLGPEVLVFGKVLLGVSYVGSRSVHLQRPVSLNDPLPGLAAAQRVNVNFVRPYFGYGTITERQTSGNAWYHSMQVSLNRRMSRSLQAGIAYTWSRSMDDGSSERDAGDVPPNSRNFAAERGPSNWDRTHVFTSNFLWALPKLARGRVSGNPLLRGVMNGWSLSGITRLWSGTPFDVALSSDVAGIGAVQNQRPDIVADTKGPRTVEEWFNRAAFARPATGAFGNMGRNSLRRPGVNKWDLSAFKEFAMRENLKLQFRGEFFNAFNHPSFSGVNATLTTTATGVNPAAGSFAWVTDTRDARVMQFALKLRF